MLWLPVLPVLLLSLLVGNPAFSADAQKGYDAIKRGDYATALRILKPLAEQGDALAQTVLGAMYAEGEGVPQNYKTAVKWYTLAAEQGFASAQYNLGVMYQFGTGVPQKQGQEKDRKEEQPTHSGISLAELWRLIIVERG